MKTAMTSGEEDGDGGGKKPKGEAAPAVAAVGDDLLGDIFLRLPDTASLCRAALACKRWRRVASDRALLRRFHSLHRPPLVGVILSDRGDKPVPYRCPYLHFVPVRSGNPHLAAATSVGDFFFTNLPEHNFDSDDEEGNRIRRDPWMLRCCDGGLLLLSRGRHPREDLAVYDPFARTAVFFRGPDLPFHVVYYAFLADEADASLFRVVAAQFFDDDCSPPSSYRAAIYSSRNREWSPHPSYRTPHPWNARDATRAGRFACWQSNTKKYWDSNDTERVMVLDTTTMEWSLRPVPFLGESYCIADMAEYGGLCFVGAREQCLQLLASTDDGWVKKKQVPLMTQFPFLKKIRREEGMRKLLPLAVRGDYVFMEFWSIKKSQSYILLLNLKTMDLEMVKNDSSEPCRGSAFPFFMSWAPPLLSPGI